MVAGAMAPAEHRGEHPDTLSWMGSLAHTLWAQGDLAGARSLEEQVLAAHRRVLGEGRPDPLNSMNNLAVTLWHLGEREEAIELMTRAARRRAATLGAEHPDAKSSAESLANMLIAPRNLQGCGAPGAPFGHTPNRLLS